MIINLSSSPSSSSFSLIKLSNSKSLISDFPSKPKTHHPKPLSSSICCSFSSLDLGFHCKDRFFIENGRCPHGKRFKFRTCAIPGFDSGNFESAQLVLEATAVLMAIIVVHESGHFVAAYLQGIHVSKWKKMEVLGGGFWVLMENQRWVIWNWIT
ncbi:hypothetical protein ACFX13_028752 [Malus domestica]